jgi:TonB-dependent Receptor Plug Domain
MKNALVVLALLIVGQVSAQQALGEVTGTVHEYGSIIPAVDARIVIKDGTRIYQAKADLDGEFRISAIPAGDYLVNILYDKDTMSNIPINVPMDGIARMGVIKFEGKITEIVGAEVLAYRDEVRLIDGNLPVTKITAEEIALSPVKFNVKDLITSMTSNVQQTADGQLVFRGARKGDMIYMIDGVKTSDAGTIPSVSIGYMMVYTGGLPAKYGDTLGGVVVIESKSYFDLYRAWEADQIRQGLR